MSQLPLQQTNIKDLSLLQTKWKSTLDPLLANPSNNSSIVSNIVLVANVPKTINHYLGQQMTGWKVIDINANANVWRTQPMNNTTITLQASANCVINIEVF